jgi:hypothetical protein
MATKKPEFDLVLLSGLGHRQYAVPKDAAMAIFELFAGHEGRSDVLDRCAV